MLVGVLSDTHDRVASVQAALAVLRQKRVELVLHCGDIESVETVPLFSAFPTHFVLGNWDGDWVSGSRRHNGKARDDSRLRHAITQAGGTLHEPWGELELCGRHIAWAHGHDRALLRELEQSGCYDFLFYGHTHVAEQHRTGRTLVVNPGAMFKVDPKRFAILDLLKGEVESVVVS